MQRLEILGYEDSKVWRLALIMRQIYIICARAYELVQEWSMERVSCWSWQDTEHYAPPYQRPGTKWSRCLGEETSMCTQVLK